MAYIRQAALDAGLTNIRGDITHLYICSDEPESFAEVATYALGSKAGPSLGAIGAGSPNGRQFQVDAISDGSVTDTGTASHWALTDDTGEELLATGDLTTPQGVTNGNTFTLTAFTIRFAAAVNQS
jgi:hypothetical protein